MSTNYCISNFLKVICLLQENSITNCSSFKCPYYNTRVLSFYRKDGSLYSAYYFDSSGNISISSIFRVVSVSSNCCTVLILKQNNGTYSSTGEFLTIDLKCIGAIHCILDVNVSNL